MEQRVVWELGRWQQSRQTPAAAREASDAPPHVRPAAITPSPPPSPSPSPVSGVSSAPRTSAATAPAYDYRNDVEPAPEPARPELVRRLPVDQPRTAAASIVADRPAAEPQSRRPAPLSVAPAETATTVADPPKKGRRDSKVVEAPKQGRKQKAAESPKQRRHDAPVEPPKVSRRDRKAAERAEQKRLAEEQKQAEAAERAEARKREEAEKEARRRAAAEAGSRSDRRKARKHKRLTDGITLHDGETITLTMGGWSRGRPAVLVVTRYRVVLITKLPHSLHWIPLEEVSQMRLRWRGGWTLEIEGSVEFLSLHKRQKQTLLGVQELLASEVAESRAPGGRRHHPEVTQDWCDRSIEMWETHAGQIRLFIRRHPLLVVATLAIWVPVAYYFALR